MQNPHRAAGSVSRRGRRTKSPWPPMPSADVDDAHRHESMPDFDRVWKIVIEIGLSERHFNELQGHYRVLASTWLLATFGAAGFVLTTQDIIVPIDRWALTSVIGLAGGVGLLLLWNLDLLVYARLLREWFREGLRLEAAHPWLPQVRHGMILAFGKDGVSPSAAWFYIVGSSACIGLSGVAFVSWAMASSIAVASVGGIVYAGFVIGLAKVILDQARPQRGRPLVK